MSTPLSTNEGMSPKKYEPISTHYFDCKCESPEHTLRFSYDPEDNEIYTEVFLCQYRNPFQRIWTALKYVFGFKCKFGHWDCWLMKEEDCKRLVELVNRVAKIPLQTQVLTNVMDIEDGGD